jgi:hypothetical protein
MQNTQELFTPPPKKKKTQKQNMLTIHLEILLTNTKLTLEIVLLMFFCTSHIAPKKKTICMQQNTR